MMVHEWLGVFIVAAMAFADASILPIPIEPVLIGWTLGYPKLGWWLAFAYLAASVLGAPIGYVIGHRGVATFLQKRIRPDQWEKVQEWTQRYGAFGVMLGGLTVIPYPAFTITAGIFQMPLWQLLLAVAIGRGAKGFVSVAVVLHFGRPALFWLKEVSIVALVVVAGAIILVWLWLHLRKPYRSAVRQVGEDNS